MSCLKSEFSASFFVCPGFMIIVSDRSYTAQTAGPDEALSTLSFTMFTGFFSQSYCEVVCPGSLSKIAGQPTPGGGGGSAHMLGIWGCVAQMDYFFTKNP